VSAGLDRNLEPRSADAGFIEIDDLRIGLGGFDVNMGGVIVPAAKPVDQLTTETTERGGDFGRRFGRRLVVWFEGTDGQGAGSSTAAPSPARFLRFIGVFLVKVRGRRHRSPTWILEQQGCVVISSDRQAGGHEVRIGDLVHCFQAVDMLRPLAVIGPCLILFGVDVFERPLGVWKRFATNWAIVLTIPSHRLSDGGSPSP